MFYSQLEYLCKKNNTTVSNVIQILGLSKGSVTSWRNGVIPKGDTIIKLAKYFNVSTDYILTGEIQSSDLCDSEKELLTLFRSLPDDGKERVKGYIDGYIDALGTDK